MAWFRILAKAALLLDGDVVGAGDPGDFADGGWGGVGRGGFLGPKAAVKRTGSIY